MLYCINCGYVFLSDMNRLSAWLNFFSYRTLFSLSSSWRVAAVAPLCILLWCAIYWANVLP
ncbi:hypothetical protein EQP49_12815 [Yersinia sp. 2105 StPb PI]|nr:hypothetical protein CBW53_05385 [Yersinia frederiksenii]RXA95737.1 hypothetical protein EQP49_12815 [Yersinia sp. 2105 StPb PI]